MRYIAKSYSYQVVTYTIAFIMFCIIFAPCLVQAGQGASLKNHVLPTDKRLPPLPASKYRDIERRHSIEGSSGRFRLYVSYPSLGNPIVDANIRLWALQQVDTFTRGVEEISDPSARFSLLVTYQSFFPSLRCASVVFSIVTETGDSLTQHGMVTFTFDRHEGTLLRLEDLFDKPQALLPFLSAYCYEELLQQAWANDNPGLLAAGTAPEPANFMLFNVDSLGITIHFPKNQVADSSVEAQSVTIPLNQLIEFGPKFIFWESGSN